MNTPMCGVCGCGCGRATRLAPKTRSDIGWIKGQPQRFVVGHHPVTHGLSSTREHHIWRKMINRCHNPRNDRYRNYGGRGITVCERWRESFTAFLADMGPAPSLRHSIDRIDNDGNYEPGNCRWATSRQQCRNYRRNHFLTIDGMKRCISEWSEISGTDFQTIEGRLRRNWDPARAVFEAVRPHWSNSFHGSTP